MIIVGITGTIGAGKGTVVHHLTEKYGFKHFSARNFITTEILSRGLEVNRDNMTFVGNELREKYGPGFIVESLYIEALAANQNAIIESIRTIGEIDSLKQKDSFTLFAVDADRLIRFERVVKRQSETDKISFEKFVFEEEREMNSADKSKQNIAGCVKRADFIFTNNGTKEELKKQVDLVMGKELNVKSNLSNISLTK